MKIRKEIFAAAAIIAVIALAGCATTGSKSNAAEEIPPPPPGTVRVMLENGAYAIFRFDLPAGATWANYNKVTAEYMIDEANLKKPQRNGDSARLMGVYKEEQFEVSGKVRNFNLGDGPASSNGPYIIDNTGRKFSSIGAVPDEWFTVEYDISGSKAHAQFVKNNLPAPTATGPFYLGVGMPGMGEGRRQGITQLIRNVTLHHASDPSLNVVSKGSGFDEPTFVSFFPVLSTLESGGPAE